ncbi:hypothetical protein [Roseomonas gilardii]
MLFLKANGIELDIAAPQAVEQMLRLLEGRLDEVIFAAWLRVSRRG